MADPVGPLESWLVRNGAIIVGLGIGTAAKYGLTLTEGRKLTWKGLLIDLLLLGMLGVIAITIADWCSLTGNPRVLVGALSAVSSDRLVRLARDRFMKKAETDLGMTARATPASAMRVPSGIGEPNEVQVQPSVADSDHARAGSTLRTAFRETTRRQLPRDQVEIIKRLGDEI